MWPAGTGWQTWKGLRRAFNSARRRPCFILPSNLKLDFTLRPICTFCLNPDGRLKRLFSESQTDRFYLCDRSATRFLCSFALVRTLLPFFPPRQWVTATRRLATSRRVLTPSRHVGSSGSARLLFPSLMQKALPKESDSFIYSEMRPSDHY